MATRPRFLRALGGAASLIVAAALAVVVLTPTVANAADIGISARPANADGPDGRTRFSYQVDPGQKVDDHFLVTNTGTTAQVFTIVGTDAFNDAEGAFALLPTDQEPELIGRWVTFENGANRIQFTLAPGESRNLAFSLALPPEATPGDHVGGLVASVVTPGSQVDLDRRVATRLYARVSGELQPRLAVSSFEPSYAGDWWNLLNGTVTVRYTVENPGNVALSANITNGVNTWFGIPAADSQGGSIPDILPGNSVAFEYQVPGVAQWGYLNPGIRLNPFVDDPDPAKQLPVPATSRDGVTLAMPWLVVIVLLVGVLIALWIWWRRRREDARARAWMDYTATEAREAAQREAGLVGAGTSADG